MKNQAVVLFSKINKTHIQMVLILVTLAMLVIGAGAPTDFGHVGR
jgi:hypothetical protein